MAIVVSTVSGDTISVEPPLPDNASVADLRKNIATNLGLLSSDIFLACDSGSLKDEQLIRKLLRGKDSVEIIASIYNRGEGWATILEDYLLGTELGLERAPCFAAMMASYVDGVAYACAPTQNEEGWAFCQQSYHDKSLFGDDGARFGRITVKEAAGLRDAVDFGRSPAGGLWLGSLRYVVLQYDEMTCEIAGLSSIKTLVCVAKNPEDLPRLIGQRQGAHIVLAGSQIVVGLFDEAKGQTANNCRAAVIKFIEYFATEEW